MGWWQTLAGVSPGMHLLCVACATAAQLVYLFCKAMYICVL